MVHVILAVGLNILVGSTGQISLGHAGFFAIGAYGTALLMAKLQLPFCGHHPRRVYRRLLRLHHRAAGTAAGGPYLAIATLGFGLTIMHIIGGWSLRRPDGHQDAAAGPGDHTWG